jgi:hypothetical protein
MSRRKKLKDGQKFSRSLLPTVFGKHQDRQHLPQLTEEQQKQINLLRVPSVLHNEESGVQWLCFICSKEHTTGSRSATELPMLHNNDNNQCYICGRPRGYVSQKKALQPGYFNPTKVDVSLRTISAVQCSLTLTADSLLEGLPSEAD